MTGRSAARRPGFSAEAMKGIVILASAAGVVVCLAVAMVLWLVSLGEAVHRQRGEFDLVAARAAKKAGEGASRLTQADAVDGMFLPGGKPGLAFAAFQTVVKDAALRSGLAVQRMQPLGTEGEGADAVYRLAVDAEGSIDQFRSFLAGIESTLPVMFVAGAEIRPQAAAGAEDAFPSEKLRASLRIEAHAGSASP